MTRRRRLLWRGVAFATLLAMSASPVLPQDQNTQTPPPRTPRGRPNNPLRVPRPRRGEGMGGPGMRPEAPAGPTATQGVPNLPAPAPAPPKAAPPGRPTASSPAPAASSSPNNPPNKLDPVQLGNGQEGVRMEVYDLDLDHLLRLLSSTAHVTITHSEAVKGKVTIIAPDPVPLDVAFQILNSILQMRGYAMVKDGIGLYKIMPMSDAAAAGLHVNFSNNPEEVPDTAELITQVVQLKNLSADDVAGEISSLLSSGVGAGGQQPGAASAPFTARVVPTSTNALIITDTAANVKRALTIIADMEQQFSGGFKVFRLQYYDAATMANVINSVVFSRSGGGGGGVTPTAARPRAWERQVQGGAPRPVVPGQAARQQASASQEGAIVSGSEFIFPDTKTNSLVVQATPIHLEQIQKLVDDLDKPISLRDSFVVYPVQNLSASDLAQRIGQHLGIQVNVTQPTGTQGTSRTGQGRTNTSPFGGTNYGGRGGSPYRGGGTYNPIGGGGGFRGMDSSDASKTNDGSSSLEVEPTAAPSDRADPMQVAQAPEGIVPAVPPAPVPTGPEAAPGGGDDQEVLSPGGSGTSAVISADDNTNTIVVTASPEVADQIHAMLEQLDVLPPQVYIQAIIAEVNLGTDQSLGVEWDNLLASLRRDNDQFTGSFGTSFGVGSRNDAGNLVKTVGTGLSGFITGPAGFAAVLNALRTNSNVRILSTPSIFTSNNEEGTIQVGQQIPFPTSSTTTPTGTGTGITTVVTQNVQWQTVGIQLFVTPRVTQGDVVRLDVSVSANDVGATVKVGGQEYPTTQQREAEATLSIKDGYTIVLGGLMRDAVTKSASEVPILGQIPLIGSLFRSSRTKVDKTELLVFLTPRVVRTAADAARVSEEEKSKLPEIPKSLQKPLAPTPQEQPAPQEPAPQALPQ